MVLFVEHFHGKMLFKTLKRKNAENYFIWIASDSLNDEHYGPVSDGMFTFTYTIGIPADFAHYYRY